VERAPRRRSVCGGERRLNDEVEDEEGRGQSSGVGGVGLLLKAESVEKVSIRTSSHVKLCVVHNRSVTRPARRN
jgi:anti-sigma regulatory factor (Ser/Thr protein kinase)